MGFYWTGQDTSEDRISNFENISEETLKTKKQRENKTMA
jgi:hypothetical protein